MTEEEKAREIMPKVVEVLGKCGIPSGEPVEVENWVGWRVRGKTWGLQWGETTTHDIFVRVTNRPDGPSDDEGDILDIYYRPGRTYPWGIIGGELPAGFEAFDEIIQGRAPDVIHDDETALQLVEELAKAFSADLR